MGPDRTRCFESTAQHGGMMKPPFGVARGGINIYPFPGVKVTETNRGCLKKRTIQWCLAKVDGVRSGSGKNHYVFMGFWGKKKKQVQVPPFWRCIIVYHTVVHFVYQPCQHLKKVLELAPFLYVTLLVTWKHPPTLLVLSTKHFIRLAGFTPSQVKTEVFAVQMIQIQWCS